MNWGTEVWFSNLKMLSSSTAGTGVISEHTNILGRTAKSARDAPVEKLQSTVVDEIQLIEGLKSGDRGSFRYAVDHYSPAMLVTARAIVGVSQAEDIVQEAWLSVFQRISGFERRASLRTWLQRVVANRAISYLRANGEKFDSILPDGSIESGPFRDNGSWASSPILWHSDSPEALLSADKLRDCIDRQLEEMNEVQRSVLVMRDMNDMSFAEICNALALSASNARVLLHRGRMRLMKMVDKYQETGAC